MKIFRFTQNLCQLNVQLRMLVACAFLVPKMALTQVDSACAATTCIAPNAAQANALLDRLELLFPAYLPSSSAAVTQTASVGNDTAYYRTYSDGSVGIGTFQGNLWVYTTAQNWQRISTLDDANQQFCQNTCFSAPNPKPAGGTFNGNVVLGSPTSSAIKANVYSPDKSGHITLIYGKTPGVYAGQTPIAALTAGNGTELAVNGLDANTRYYYRLYYQSSSNNGSGLSDEFSFQTARAPGSSFTFTIQGDSHPERDRSEFNAELYRRTLQTAAADKPDFHIAIGDDFSVDTLNPTTISQALVRERYTIQRPYFSLIGHSAPLFLVNGNHEQAARYLLDGTPNNLAVWGQNARNSLYAQPEPGDFYSGNGEAVPFIGLLRNRFAWTWGDALFVVLDPYWSSPVCVDNRFDGSTKRNNLWDITHGDAQYQWLKTTLEQSKSKYKFVFAHHVMGTGRGGIELAGLYEWGGRNPNGNYVFASQRPTWAMPIHQLMAANRVNIFFQGHDHIWVRQQLDGVTYQTLPEPADPNYALHNTHAFLSGDKFPNTGYTRVNVSPTQIKVDYVRTYLAADEGAGKVSGETVFSYTLP